MEFFVLPQPKELIAAVLFLVFMLFHFERYVHMIEHRFHVKKVHTVLVVIIMILPVFFVHWQTEDELMLVSQLISYTLAVTVCSIFGMIFASEGKNSKV